MICCMPRLPQVDVNGADTHPVYKHLKHERKQMLMEGVAVWAVRGGYFSAKELLQEASEGADTVLTALNALQPSELLFPS